jgi:2-oxoglutarate ferredoxin oxidoreductase subunit beta
MAEFLSACPTNWKMSPQQATRRIADEMVSYFPLGVFREARE